MVGMPSVEKFASLGQGMASDPRLLIFDLDYRGHHPGYIQYLVKYWRDRHLPGRLDVLVSQQFLQRHPQVVALGSAAHRVRFVAITAQEQANLFESADLETSFKGRIVRAFQEWTILRKYTKALGSTHAMVMYLDTVLLRLALGASLSCRFSGIYFRPIFHYDQFPNYTPAGRERLWQWRDRVCLNRLVRSRQLSTLFCLDSFAAEAINRMDRQQRATYLPDPVEIQASECSMQEDLRQRFGVEPGRMVCLLFGVLTERKGMYQVLESVRHLAAAEAKQLCFWLVGTIHPAERLMLQAKIQEVQRSHPIQICCQHDFVPDTSVSSYFQQSDVILAPYQRHIGMSGILLHAAAAQRPVLSSDFGLMGEVVRRHQLGITVNSEDPAAIAQGLRQFLWEPAARVGQPEAMRQFAEQNRAAEFAARVFQAIAPVLTDGLTDGLADG